MSIHIRKAGPLDAWDLSHGLRKADAEEISGQIGSSRMKDHYIALVNSITASPHTYSAWAGEGLVAVWGVRDDLRNPQIGIPWFLATSLMSEHKPRILRESKRWIRLWDCRYEGLGNWVSEKHDDSLRWLKWLGFHIDHHNSIVLNGIVFFPFFRKNPLCLS